MNYTNERNTLILIALLKAHGIKKIVASPGAMNISFVASVQQDPFFEIYSSVDERSAAYIACGLSAQSNEPVVLSCTGATASRNYVPGMTEAYYKKHPILAITSSQRISRIGHYYPQVIDRTNTLNDITNISVNAPVVNDKEDEWNCSININKAILELKRNGGGPAHINLETIYSSEYNTHELPKVQKIDRITIKDKFPELKGRRIAIFVGAHPSWDEKLATAVEEFCDKYDAVVLCDRASNYFGKHRVLANLVTDQEKDFDVKHPDILIHIGTVSGAYMSLKPKCVWRVNPDGEIRDLFKKLNYVFEMDEYDFFIKYASQKKEKTESLYLSEWNRIKDDIKCNLPELPFSNIWAAKNTAEKLPNGSVLHLGILNSLRSWNLFETESDILSYANTGGFGIDGCVSTLIGASLADPKKIFFGIVGDLAFFYDMNAIGNRHIGNNVRLMIINNGLGIEFRNYKHKGAQFGEKTNDYIAAAGHYGNKSKMLIKHYAEDLGFEYLSASNKDEFLNNINKFVSPNTMDRSIIFEVFTDAADESEALKLIKTIRTNDNDLLGIKKTAKNILGERGIKAIKSIIKG